MIAATVGVLVGTGGAAASFQPPPDDGAATWVGNDRLAYYSLRAPGGLRILDLQSGTERVAPMAASVVSPDGQWVARVDYSGIGANRRAELVAERFDGSERHVLLMTPSPGDVAWSPDSTMLAFNAGTAAFVSRPDGTGLIKLADNAGTPAWAPDGRELSVTLSEAGRGDLAVVNSDGSGLRVVAPSFLNGVWSPDGRSIARRTFINNEWQIRIVDVASGAISSYTTKYGVFDDPSVLSWAADSSALIYSADASSFGVAPPVYRLDVASGAQTALISSGYDAHYSPDGSRIVFLARVTGDCTAGNYVATATGGDITRVTNNCDATPPLALRLDHTLVPLDRGILLSGTAPTSRVTIQIQGGCGEHTPSSVPTSGGQWTYGFIPCRNGGLAVFAGSTEISATFAVTPRLTLRRLSRKLFQLTATTHARLTEQPVVQFERRGTWKDVKTLTLQSQHRMTGNLVVFVAKVEFFLRTAPHTRIRVFASATTAYRATASNVVTG